MLFSGLIGMVLVLLVAFWRRVPDFYDDFCVAVALPIGLLLLKPFGMLSGWLRPVTMDAGLRSVDLALHLDGFALTRWCWGHGTVMAVLSFTYEVLPLCLAVAWVVTRSKLLLRACVLGVPLAFLFYMLVPAVGPAYTFTNWPVGGDVLQPAMALPRNCFPSMHLTWAMLLAVNTKSYWRGFFSVYSVLMAVATIVSGQHYTIDILAALPFTFAVQYISSLSFDYHRAFILSK